MNYLETDNFIKKYFYMDISGVNIASSWSLAVFFSVYGVGYYFVDIFLGNTYPLREKMREGEHISIRALHYLFWGFLTSIAFIYFILVNKQIVDSLRSLMQAVYQLVSYFSPNKTVDVANFWLALSVIHLYTFIFLAEIMKFIFCLPKNIFNFYRRNEIALQSQGFYTIGFAMIVLGAFFLFWLIFRGLDSVFLQKYLAPYRYIIINILYYILAFAPMSVYVALIKINSKKYLFSPLGVFLILVSVFLLLISISSAGSFCMHSVVNIFFGGDALNSVSLFLMVLSLVVIAWGVYFLDKASKNAKMDLMIPS